MKRWLTVWWSLLALTVTAGDYFFRLLPGEYGVEVQQISVIFQSREGLIWLGTDQGLLSFDGRRYKFHRRPDQQLHTVTALAESPDGRIWAGYEDGYLHSTFFQGHAQAILHDSIRNVSITQILFTPDHQMIVTTYGQGAWQFHHQRWKKIRHGDLQQIRDIYDASLTADGRLWLATDNGVWVYLEKPSPEVRHISRADGLLDDIITHLAAGPGEQMMVGHYDFAIAGLQMNHYQVQELLRWHEAEGQIVNINYGRQGCMWVATEKQIWQNRDGHTWEMIRIPFVMKNRITGFLMDQSGNLWLATGNRLYMADTQMEFIDPALTGIQSVLTRKDRIWYGCENGLFCTDRNGKELKQHLQNEALNVLSLYEDPSGMIWVGTFGQGVYIFHPETHRVKHLTEKDKLSNTSILNISGRDNRIWLATLGGITEISWKSNPLLDPLLVSDLQEEFQFPPGYVYDVFVSNLDRVWFGTDGKGLFRKDQQGIHPVPIRMKNDTSGAALRTIYSIQEDHQNRLWVSTVKGSVICIDPDGNEIMHFGAPQGAINSLTQLGDGHMMMVREGHIMVLAPSGQIYEWDESSGLTGFNPQLNALYQDTDGSVWIADTDMILHHVISDTGMDRQVTLHITDISPGHLWSEDELILKPERNFLDIQYVGVWYQDPAEVSYRYQLEGHDKDWIYTQDRRAVYSRLAPGSYRFILQATHHDDFTNATVLTREITVMPPFYQRWWFITIALIGIITGVIWFIRNRIKRISRWHELQKEKTMHQLHAIQAQVNPHFLFNSFNTLSSIIEEDQQAAVEYVDQLSAFFRRALTHRGDELIRLTEELEIVRNYMYILKTRYGENIHIVENIKNTSGWIAPLSIQLLVENAIKHNTVSADRNLTIDIEVDPHWVTVSNPIQPKFQILTESTGFGLSSLITRYTYLTPQKIEVTTQHHRFTVRIPVIQKDADA